MKELVYTKRFGKSLKTAKKRGKNLEKLFDLLELLQNDSAIPHKNRNHKLTGNYAGCWELHIEPDWLLIYEKEEAQLILIDTGSHSDLFK